jgi:hypothetical protein
MLCLRALPQARPLAFEVACEAEQAAAKFDWRSISSLVDGW